MTSRKSDQGRRSDLRAAKPVAKVLQRKTQHGEAIRDVPDAVNEVLRSPGQALAHDLRGAMEKRFGRDFSQVRVHADTHAAESARAVDAAAYTVGHDVVFGAGEFAPGSAGGQKLLVHELAHVVQQGGPAAPGTGGLRIGAASDAHEAQADRAAEQVMHGGAAPSLAAASASALQRQPLPVGAPLASAGLNLPTASTEVGSEETISAGNPKLIDLAARFKGSGSSAHVEVSSSLSESAKLSSAGEQAERSRLRDRMAQIRDALVALGIPKDQIDLSAPSAYSTSAHGQVSVDLRQSAGGMALPTLGLPGFPGGPARGLDPKPVPAAPTTKSPSLSEMLTVEFGPVKIELPKSVTATLPIALSRAKSLIIELKAEAPAKFSFKLTLDGTPFVRVSAVAGAEYDTDKKVATGSAGIEIESVKTTCHATNPEETRSKIAAAGDKLMKASQEYSAAHEATKLISIAGAIGEMYDAIEKAKAACKQVPRFKIDLGVKGPLGPVDDTDPSKRTPSTIGGTLTIPF